MEIDSAPISPSTSGSSPENSPGTKLGRGSISLDFVSKFSPRNSNKKVDNAQFFQYIRHGEIASLNIQLEKYANDFINIREEEVK